METPTPAYVDVEPITKGSRKKSQHKTNSKFFGGVFCSSNFRVFAMGKSD